MVSRLNRVSIIMPAHNAEVYVEEAINSVISQSYPEWELIICLDNCSDGTKSIVERISKNMPSKIQVVEAAHRSAALSRNACILRATGHYIAFLDSDDVWDMNKLFQQVSYMDSTGVVATCTSYNVIDADGDLINIRSLGKRESIGLEELLLTCQIGCSTVMLDRSLLTDFLFPEVPKEDYALWILLAKRGVRFNCINQPLTHYREAGNSLSSNKIKESVKQWRVYRDVAGLGRVSSALYIVTYLVFGLLKRVPVGKFMKLRSW